jgi:hypothetical protein
MTIQLRFRTGLERAAEAILKLAGLPIPDWDHKSPADRLFLQSLGTDTCRVYCQDIWTRIYERQIHNWNETISDDFVIITPDVRFTNEIAIIEGVFGGIVRRVQAPLWLREQRLLARDGYLDREKMAHASETALDDRTLVEINNGELISDTCLYDTARGIWQELTEKCYAPV